MDGSVRLDITRSTGAENNTVSILITHVTARNDITQRWEPMPGADALPRDNRADMDPAMHQDDDFARCGTCRKVAYSNECTLCAGCGRYYHVQFAPEEHEGPKGRPRTAVCYHKHIQRQHIHGTIK